MYMIVHLPCIYLRLASIINYSIYILLPNCLGGGGGGDVFNSI